MLRTFLAAAGMITLLTGPVPAQTPDAPATNGIPFHDPRGQSPDEAAKGQALDRDYNAAMKKIPDKKESADPWGDVRAPSSTSAKNKPQQ